MTEDATAAAAPVKAQKKRGPRPSKARTPLSKLIVEAVGSSQSRRGVSTQAVKKVLLSRGVDVRALNTRINLALVRLVRKGVLKQVRGVGASGSFVLAKKTLEAKQDGKSKTSKITKPRKRLSAKKPRSRKPKRPSSVKKRTETTRKKKETTRKKKETTRKKKETTKTSPKKSTKRSTKNKPSKKRISTGKPPRKTVRPKKSGAGRKATPTKRSRAKTSSKK